MLAKLFLQIAAVNGFLAVALGAFGAHALKHRLDDYSRDIFQTAVNYHFIHTLALVFCSLLILHLPNTRLPAYAASAFLFGIIIFSGSLYALSLSQKLWLGALTPIGGLAFLAGWCLLFFSATRL